MPASGTGHPETPESDPPELPANSLIISADTVVCIDGRILGKPSGPEQALASLRMLAGNEHEVITACVLMGREVHEEFAVRSRVRMWNCPDEILQAYAAREEPLDKAGGYAVQGEGAFLVDCINGSWSNVVGLPLGEIIQALLRIRAIDLSPRPALRLVR